MNSGEHNFIIGLFNVLFPPWMLLLLPVHLFHKIFLTLSQVGTFLWLFHLQGWIWLRHASIEKDQYVSELLQIYFSQKTWTVTLVMDPIQNVYTVYPEADFSQCPPLRLFQIILLNSFQELYHTTPVLICLLTLGVNSTFWHCHVTCHLPIWFEHILHLLCRSHPICRSWRIGENM